MTGDKSRDDDLIWRGLIHTQFQRSHIDHRKKLAHDEEERVRALPKTDKGRMVEDLFAGLGLEIFNPDDITLDSYLEMIEDSAIRSSLMVVINSVIGRGWEIVGGKKEVRDFITKMYDNLGMESVFEQVLSAVWVGFSCTEKVFDQDENERWFIKRYKVLPPETITFEVKPNGEIVRVRQNGFLIGIAGLVRFLPKKVNVFTWDNGLQANFGNPYGRSILTGAYTDWFCKQWLIRWKQRFLELMAGGLIIANAGHGDRAVMHQQVSESKATSVITIRDGQTVEFIMPNGDGDAYLRNLIYHDKRIREALGVPILIIGQEGPFGSANLGEIHFDVFRLASTQRLQQILAMWADHDTRQISDVNFGQQEDYPRFRFKVSSQKELREMSKDILNLVRSGVLGRNDLPEIRRRLEWPDGDPGEAIGPIKPIDILQLPSSAPASPFPEGEGPPAEEDDEDDDDEDEDGETPEATSPPPPPDDQTGAAEMSLDRWMMAEIHQEVEEISRRLREAI